MVEVVKPNFGGNSEAAQQLRDIADMVESGEVRNILVTYDNQEQCHFAKWGVWRDKWHILGAIEFAKSAVFRD